MGCFDGRRSASSEGTCNQYNSGRSMSDLDPSHPQMCYEVRSSACRGPSRVQSPAGSRFVDFCYPCFDFGPLATFPHFGQGVVSYSSIQNSCLLLEHLIFILAMKPS